MDTTSTGTVRDHRKGKPLKPAAAARRAANNIACAIERLESRTLLSGVSLLTSFNTTNGSQPGYLTLSGNTLYGTTQTGGQYGDGVVFSEPVSGGAPTVLASFNGTDGETPACQLAISGNTLYGTTMGGGTVSTSQSFGEVFSLPISGGTPTVLAAFNGNDGEQPSGRLLLSNGVLYGVANNGGGEVFSLPTSGGTPTVLAQFSNPDPLGFSIIGDLQIQNNTLYGTLAIGGANGAGELYSLPISGGTPTRLASLADPGTFVIHGGIYGVQGSGSTAEVYSLPLTGGTPTILGTIAVAQGTSISSLVFSGNSLYGTTTAGTGSADAAGDVFSLSPSGGTPNILGSFSGTDSNGKWPMGLQASSNALYGTTSPSGTNTAGSIFSVALNASGVPGALSGSPATAAASYNLTTLGKSDWAHWGMGGSGSAFDHKANGGSQISNVTQVGSGGAYGGYTNTGRAVSWSDGTPVASDASDNGYLWANTAIGAGYSFTVPASTTSQTLDLYLGGYSSGGTLTAHLSDASATDYSVSLSGSALYTNLISLTYNAASAGQTLTLTYTKSSNINGTGGSVDLIAAWLASGAVAGTAPLVTTNPTNHSVTAGATATFTAAASGNPTPTVQWMVETAGSTTFTAISGATSTTLSLPATTVAQSGNEYEAVFSNGVGSPATTAAATLTVTAATAAPVVTTNPTNQSVTAGATATFTAAASGNPTPTVQWMVETAGGSTFTALSGATSTTLSLPATTIAQSGNKYEAVFSNGVGSPATTAAATLTVTAAPSGGSLSGSTSTAAASYNLTTLGTSDWAHWGVNGSGSAFDHKASGGSQISNVKTVGSGAYGGYTNSGRSVSWTDGTPVTSDASDNGYLWANTAIGAGYSFTVPATTSSQTLYVDLGGYSTGSTLTAHLSDGSATDYSVNFSGSALYTNVVAITYNAASSGQTLTLTYTKSSNINGTGGSADLIAAWLVGPAATAAPVVTTNPTNQSVTAGATATFTAAASGNPTPTVQWMVETAGGSTFTALSGATSTTLSLPATTIAQSGNKYEAVFSNGVGSPATTAAATLTVTAAPSGGSLSGSTSTAAASYNLTTLGTSDWAHWGVNGSGSAFDHKASGRSQISNVKTVGSGAYGGYTNSGRSVSWTDGTPVTSDASDNGYLWANTAIGAGYSFTVPATTTSQTLYVDLGGYSTGSTLTAHLSDGSATDYSVNFSGSALYTNLVAITYNAASSGQTLTLTYTKSSNINGTGGSADLIAAWLVPSTAPLPPGLAAPTISLAVGGDEVGELSWNATPGATSYNIYRSTTAGGEGATPHLTGLTQTTVYDENLTDGTTYYYQVTAVNSTGESGKSVEANLLPYFIRTYPPIFDSATPGDGQATLAWTGGIGTNDTYSIFRSTTPGGEGATPVATGITGTTYTDSGLSDGVTYYYEVEGVHDGIATNPSNELPVRPVGFNTPVYGQVSGQQAVAAASYNLTKLGTTDWIHWGSNGQYASDDRKSTGGSQISDVSLYGPAPEVGTGSDPSIDANWTDGSPNAINSDNSTFILSEGYSDTGYYFTVPADTTTRTLYVYAGGDGASSTLRAHLSDGSAADYAATASGAGRYADFYTITYKAASAGQTLKVILVKTGDITGNLGNAELMAAALAPGAS